MRSARTRDRNNPLPPGEGQGEGASRATSAADHNRWKQPSPRPSPGGRGSSGQKYPCWYFSLDRPDREAYKIPHVRNLRPRSPEHPLTSSIPWPAAAVLRRREHACPNGSSHARPIRRHRDDCAASVGTGRSRAEARPRPDQVARPADDLAAPASRPLHRRACHGFQRRRCRGDRRAAPFRSGELFAPHRGDGAATAHRCNAKT